MIENLTQSPPTFSTSHLVSIEDLTAAEIHELFDFATLLKADPASYTTALAGKAVIMLFEKPSLRTRVSLEAGIAKLGGIPMYFDHASPRIGVRESIKDYAKNLERWVECIVARTYDHATIEQLALHARVPVINALTDLEHPCQALADLFTLREHLGDFSGKRLAYIGDGNNVCHSLMLLCASLGVDFTAVTPPGYEPDAIIAQRAGTTAGITGAAIRITHDIGRVKGHHAVYTDKWVSMGQEGQADKASSFTPYQVNAGVMARASEGLEKDAIFMHCLPAMRGQEVTDDVIDASTSVVYDQAENRMHTQNALLCGLIG
jgi:ornithine carbamoyltransferase